MKKISGVIDVRLSTEEVAELNELIERNTAKPLVLHEYSVPNISPSHLCPNCGSVLLTAYKFCSDCGQRLDSENIAL